MNISFTTFSKFISFDANGCGYSRSSTEILVPAVHLIFLKSNSKQVKSMIPIGIIADECLKAAEINTLEGRVPEILLSAKTK